MLEVESRTMTNIDGAVTVQKERISGGASSVLTSAGGLGASAMSFMMQVGASISQAPTYWSPNRDEWLNKFWRLPGNDLLAGAISTLQAKIVAAGWYVDGPMSIALAVRDMLLNRSNFGDGWDNMIYQWTEGFLTRDAGGKCERLRASASDFDGPALGYAHIDESRCRNTGDPKYPVLYNDGKDLRKIHRSQIMMITDLPSGQDKYKGVGFCGVSRAITTALVLMDITRYKRERLSDLPPAGILLLNNLTETEWEDLVVRYDARQRNEGNVVWRDIMVACGIDPQFPISADLFELSRLPEHYDEKIATEIAVNTFALAFRVDARELWPISSGPLGTAAETEIQHKKAKAKGEGVIFAAIERQLNNPLSLPPMVKFHFDYRDDEEDARAAAIDSVRIANIRRMWETSPNRGDPEGIITTDEARKLLVLEGLIPPEIVGMTMETDRIYDVRSGLCGPPARVYNDGRVLPL